MNRIPTWVWITGVIAFLIIVGLSVFVGILLTNQDEQPVKVVSNSNGTTANDASNTTTTAPNSNGTTAIDASNTTKTVPTTTTTATVQKSEPVNKTLPASTVGVEEEPVHVAPQASANDDAQQTTSPMVVVKKTTTTTVEPVNLESLTQTQLEDMIKKLRGEKLYLNKQYNSKTITQEGIKRMGEINEELARLNALFEGTVVGATAFEGFTPFSYNFAMF